MRVDQAKYSETHEWVRVEDDGATIGITDFAQEELGDIVAVELPAVGSSVSAGEPFGTVDSVKAVSDLIAPVSGEVTAVNESLLATPELLNNDPFGEGWTIKVRLSDPSELEGLMTVNEYESFLKQA
jgi:glycine cleavage system H protein